MLEDRQICREAGIILLLQVVSYSGMITFLHSHTCWRVEENYFILKSHLLFSRSFCFHSCPTAIHSSHSSQSVILKMQITAYHDPAENPPVAPLILGIIVIPWYSWQFGYKTLWIPKSKAAQVPYITWCHICCNLYFAYRL